MTDGLGVMDDGWGSICFEGREGEWKLELKPLLLRCSAMVGEILLLLCSQLYLWGPPFWVRFLCM